ncbi:hypothetical protein ACFLQV_04250 [Calditrichota bacterium]
MNCHVRARDSTEDGLPLYATGAQSAGETGRGGSRVRDTLLPESDNPLPDQVRHMH